MAGMHSFYSDKHRLHNTDGVRLGDHPFITEEIPARAEILARVKDSETVKETEAVSDQERRETSAAAPGSRDVAETVAVRMALWIIPSPALKSSSARDSSSNRNRSTLTRREKIKLRVP